MSARPIDRNDTVPDILEIPGSLRGKVGFTGLPAMLDGEDRYDVATFAATCVAAAHALTFSERYVEVDIAEAAEAFRSERHLSIDGAAPA